MTTPAKATANRRNALRSTGPRTPAGKAVSSKNATRHGLRSASPVVPGLETTREWNRHRAAILDAIEPLGALEEALADRVALLLWRLGRVARYERETIANGLESIPEDLREYFRTFHRWGSEEHPLLEPAPDEVADFAEDAAKDRRFLEDLSALADEAPLAAEPAVSALYRVEKAAELDLEELSFPSIPNETPLEDVAWTAGLLRQVIAAVAASAGLDRDELVSSALVDATREEIRYERQTKEVESRGARMRCQRILPDGDTLQKVSRYEAHLDRVLVRTLHELHRLQAARRSGAAPPVALDVDLTVSERKRVPTPAEVVTDTSEES